MIDMCDGKLKLYSGECYNQCANTIDRSTQSDDTGTKGTA